MSRKRKKKIELDQSDGFGQSFGDALGKTLSQRLDMPLADAPEVEAVISTRSDEPRWQISMLVSRKGRGGKTVIECSGVLCADEAQRKIFAKKVSKTLGTRVFWSDDLLCVQGDLRDRLRTLFEREGHEVKPH